MELVYEIRAPEVVSLVAMFSEIDFRPWCEKRN